MERSIVHFSLSPFWQTFYIPFSVFPFPSYSFSISEYDYGVSCIHSLIENQNCFVAVRIRYTYWLLHSYESKYVQIKYFCQFTRNEETKKYKIHFITCYFLCFFFSLLCQFCLRFVSLVSFFIFFVDPFV